MNYRLILVVLCARNMLRAKFLDVNASLVSHWHNMHQEAIGLETFGGRRIQVPTAVSAVNKKCLSAFLVWTFKYGVSGSHILACGRRESA